MEITEPRHNVDLLRFIKTNKKVTMNQIKNEFPIDDEVINLNNLVEEDLQTLIDIGKVKFINDYYIAI